MHWLQEEMQGDEESSTGPRTIQRPSIPTTDLPSTDDGESKSKSKSNGPPLLKNFRTIYVARPDVNRHRHRLLLLRAAAKKKKKHEADWSRSSVFEDTTTPVVVPLPFHSVQAELVRIIIM